MATIKRERKIFFLLNWLDGFIGGHKSEEARAQVYKALGTALDHDLRLKILQVVGELDRTVRIRQSFPD